MLASRVKSEIRDFKGIVMVSIPAIIMSYLMGSISFAIIVSRFLSLDDPRSYGSGNPGATNVLRSGNKKAAILTLLGDAVKGVIPVLIVRYFSTDELLIAAVAMAVFLGHLWPIFFRFQGGKGVATAVGVLLALNPWLGLACLATWLLVAFISRLSSLSALTAALLAPVYGHFIVHSQPITIMLCGMTVLLFWRHQKNIIGLVKGTESKIGAKKAVSTE